VATVVEVVAQRAVQEPLGGAPSVALRRIEQVHAEIAAASDRIERGALVGGAPIAAQLPGSERDRRDLQTGHAEGHVLHCSPPLRGLVVKSMSSVPRCQWSSSMRRIS